MIRIVGIQRNSDPSKEFVLVQNQGGLRVNLKSHILLGEPAIESDENRDFLYLFRDDMWIGAGNYVLLFTGQGEAKWARTKDMQLVYYTYMNREESLWERSNAAVHILAPQHSYTDKREALLLR